MLTVMIAFVVAIGFFFYGKRVGKEKAHEEVLTVLSRYLQNVRWSPSVRECIQVIMGNRTIDELRKQALEEAKLEKSASAEGK